MAREPPSPSAGAVVDPVLKLPFDLLITPPDILLVRSIATRFTTLMAAPTVTGCHLVGSVPLPDTETVLRQCLAGMPGRLKRIPDGETGFRHYFTLWQSNVFQASPIIQTKFVDNAPIAHTKFTEAEVDEGIAKLQAAGPLKTGYDDAAIQSYGVFERLREQGVIPRGVRFQVCLPTAASVLSPFVEGAFQAKIEPIYEEALFFAMRRIQDHIPHEELSFQIDLAADTGMWEGLEMFPPWFGGDVKEYTVEYIARMIGQVDVDVDVGLHNCYGDMEHRHWFEPRSLSNVVDRTLKIISKISRPLNFSHFPVPKSALDSLPAYLAPLKDLESVLKEQGMELYLGVVHFDDLATTTRMIAEAGKVVSHFGVATECGWGRTPSEQVKSIMEISNAVTQPVL